MDDGRDNQNTILRFLYKMKIIAHQTYEMVICLNYRDRDIKLQGSIYIYFCMGIWNECFNATYRCYKK